MLAHAAALNPALTSEIKLGPVTWSLSYCESPERTADHVIEHVCLVTCFFWVFLFFFPRSLSLWRAGGGACSVTSASDCGGVGGRSLVVFFFVPLCWMTVASLVDMKPETHQTVFNCPVKPVKPVHNPPFAPNCVNVWVVSVCDAFMRENHFPPFRITWTKWPLRCPPQRPVFTWVVQIQTEP